jgi:hypothetical protein
MSTAEPLTREELARQFQWDQFSPQLQASLYRHYTTFTHDGNLQLARADIQSASDTLSWVLQGQPATAFLGEHRQYFGVESTNDLEAMIAAARAEKEQPGGRQEQAGAQ